LVFVLKTEATRKIEEGSEAPASWRRELTFTTPVEADHAFAANLVRAALDRTWLPHE
jgi:hypothetical protein